MSHTIKQEGALGIFGSISYLQVQQFSNIYTDDLEFHIKVRDSLFDGNIFTNHFRGNNPNRVHGP